MADIQPFLLKEFFYTPEAGAAEYNLSCSFAEPIKLGELLELETGARDQLDALALGYTGLDGSQALKEAIAPRYPGLGGPTTSSPPPDSTTRWRSSPLALIEPSERIVVQTPAYQTYMTVPAWRGAEVAEWRARAEHGWLPDLDELDTLLQTPTRWLMVNFPNNPTGVMPDEDLPDAAARARRSSGHAPDLR